MCFCNEIWIRVCYVVVYVDNLNINETLEELPKVVDYFKKEFEQKTLQKQSLLPLANQVFSRWNSYPSVNLQRKCPKPILHGENTSMEYPNGCSVA